MITLELKFDLLNLWNTSLIIKDAQRLASRENHWIDEYQEKNQCLEQVPEGKRPSIESWERQKEKYKNRSNKS